MEEIKNISPEKKKKRLFKRQRSQTAPEPEMARPEVGLVIDGRTLNVVFQGGLEAKFLELTKHCRSVLCCRATPLQKSMVVKLVRDKLNVMTLSIGKSLTLFLEVEKEILSLVSLIQQWLVQDSLKCTDYLT